MRTAQQIRKEILKIAISLETNDSCPPEDSECDSAEKIQERARDKFKAISKKRSTSKKRSKKAAIVTEINKIIADLKKSR